MNALQKRLKGAVEWHGDLFTIGGVPHRGVFTVLSPAAARDYLPQEEIDALPRPIRLVLVAFDDASTVGAAAVWGSQTLIVRKVVEVRHQNSVAAKFLVMA